MENQAERFVAAYYPVNAEHCRIAVTPLSGGLEAAVARATVKGGARGERRVSRRFIIKQLRAGQRREAGIYDELWRASETPPAARVLGSSCEDEADYLFLEDVRPFSNWPWSEIEVAGAVCRVLARLHRFRPARMAAFSDWDYEEELRQSAASTLAVALEARNSSGNRIWRRLGDLRRVVEALPAIRGLLREEEAIIHGDMHPGNVLVRRRGRARQVVLIDWARARLGSPLEDIASWLHSLGCWEPDARRRHDTLLRIYLEAWGERRKVTAALRQRYWYASASNGLSGAIRYHLAVLTDSRSSDQLRQHSSRALAEWERVIRRVAAILATSSRH